MSICGKWCLITILFLFCMPWAKALSVQGTVLDGNGKMLPEARVWLAESETVQKASTDSEGHFLFDHVKTGAIEVVALKEGYSLGGYSAFLLQDKTLEIRLNPPDTLSFRVINQNFFPVAGARVKWLLVRGGFSIPAARLTEQGFPAWRAAEDGVVSVPGLTKGAIVQFAVGHGKYADTIVDFLDVGGKRQDVVLYEGIKLGGRVSVGNKWMANARVTLFRTGVHGARVFAEAMSDPEGLYHLRAAKGEYLVQASHPEYASPEAVPVNLTEETKEQTLDLTLTTPKVIEGSVEFPDGKPCPGVWIQFHDGKQLLTENHTDEAGHFRLLAGKPEGILTVTPPEGFMTETLADIPVKLGDANRAQLKPVRLRELPVIKGHITDVDSRVLISSLDLTSPLWTLSDAKGNFEIHFNYAPEKETVRFRAEHARLLRRGDFEVNLKNPHVPEITLEPFDPDTAQRPPAPSESDLSALLGKPAPAWQCSDWFNSDPLLLEALRGKVIVLTFWAGFDDSPKGVNRIEELRALADTLGKTEDVQFIGVHDEASVKEEVKQYVERLGISFPVGRDAESSVTFSNYKIGAIPATVLIDKKGFVRYFTVEGRLLELIKVLLAE